jgi:hypothetical protein
MGYEKESVHWILEWHQLSYFPGFISLLYTFLLAVAVWVMAFSGLYMARHTILRWLPIKFNS